MSAEVHSETELYRVESRPASKLLWIETIGAVATRLWRVFPAQRRFATARRAVATTESLARSECLHRRGSRSVTLRWARCRDLKPSAPCRRLDFGSMTW